jgi:hypothetical protein
MKRAALPLRNPAITMGCQPMNLIKSPLVLQQSTQSSMEILPLMIVILLQITGSPLIINNPRTRLSARELHYAINFYLCQVFTTTHNLDKSGVIL